MTDDPETLPRHGFLKPSLPVLRDVLIVLAISVFGLNAGAGFLVPLTLAVLVFVLVAAVSDGAIRVSAPVLALPRWIADLVGVFVVLSGLFAIMFVLGNQATQFARALPRYEAQFDQAISRIGGMLGADLTAALQTTLINVDLSRLAVSAFGGATSFVNTFLLICIYVSFMMVERRMMAHKILLAIRNPDLEQEISSIMATISFSLQRYVSVKTFVSVLTALVSYAMFRAIGLDFPETWAVLTFALNFIPSIGSVIAVIFPALVSLVQFDDITPFLVIVFFCGTVQFLLGNVLDPALLGRSLNLSTFMVIIALTFWSAVWGLIGAFLSVPLTVCVLIVLSQIPAARPVAILMSKDGQLGATAPQDPGRA